MNHFNLKKYLHEKVKKKRLNETVQFILSRCFCFHQMIKEQVGYNRRDELICAATVRLKFGRYFKSRFWQRFWSNDQRASQQSITEMSGYLQLQFSAENDLFNMTREHYMGSRGASIQVIAVQGWAMPAIIVNQSPKLCSVCHSKWNATLFNTFHANSDKNGHYTAHRAVVRSVSSY